MHAVASVTFREKTLRFFCDESATECIPLDESLPLHSEAGELDDGSYAWEYAAPWMLLRRCPEGSVMVNSTQIGGQFAQAVQQCSPCGPGRYIVDPLHGPCVKCPDGADCPGSCSSTRALPLPLRL